MVATQEPTQTCLQRKMQEAFFNSHAAGFQKSSELTVLYRIIGSHESSRVGRYLTGGLAGGSKSFVEATFDDASR